MARLLYVAVAALVIASAMASTYVPSVPCFFWAGQSYFSGHANAGDVLTSSDLTSILTQLTGQSGSSAWVSDSISATPEVVVAFINHELSSGGASKSSGAYSVTARPSALKAALAGSVSSLSVPFVALDGARSSDVIVDAFSQATVVQISLESSSCDAVVAAAVARADLFSNGVADLIVVNSADAAATEACLDGVSSAVNSATNGRYVALLTGDVASVSRTLPSFGSSSKPSFITSSLLNARAALAHDKARVLASADGTTDDDITGPQYVTSNILIGLIVVGGLIAVMLAGVCLTLQIEAPLRFAGPTQKLVIGKEF